MGEPKCTQRKCPKGTHMNKCNATHIECKACPPHTFTDVENQMEKCRPCRKCSEFGNLVTVECTADRNTQCRCKQHYYCNIPNDDDCEHCVPASKCDLGEEVIQTYKHLADTKCSPCPKGTYNDVVDYTSICKNHTSCEVLGRKLKVHGTSKTDAICGDFTACGSCHWMLPAGLWAGLVVTVLIIFLILFVIYRRTKRNRSQISVVISDYKSSLPTLPPDILKYPADLVVEKQQECINCIHAENYTNMDCNAKCDFEVSPVLRGSERYESDSAASERTHSVTFHSIYQSEPQETEWHD